MFHQETYLKTLFLNDTKPAMDYKKRLMLLIELTT